MCKPWLVLDIYNLLFTALMFASLSSSILVPIALSSFALSIDMKQLFSIHSLFFQCNNIIKPVMQFAADN